MNSLRLKSYLKTHGRISLVESLIILGIPNPGAIVCELRKQYGKSSILTEYEWLKTTNGERFKCRVYRLSDEGRKRMFPVKKDFPSWLVFSNSNSNNL